MTNDDYTDALLRFLGRCLDVGIPPEFAIKATRIYAAELRPATIPWRSPFGQPAATPKGYDEMRKARLRADGMTERDWQLLRIEVLEAHDYRCVYCEQYGEVVDHDTPITLGGTFARENLVCACSTCNSRKKGLTGEQYRARMARERVQV